MSSLNSELQHTPLFEQHQALNAKVVDFGGWALPVNYGSQIIEHHAVRNASGMFDVSHMTVSDIKGVQTLDFLSYLLANDIAKVSHLAGKALYSCMLNHEGGVIDDLIVYHMSNTHCRLVTNAGTREKDMAWIQEQAKAFDVEFQEDSNAALIAVQGPTAIANCLASLNSDEAAIAGQLERFQGAFLDQSNTLYAGRTGYTGEDGLEFILPAEQAASLWLALLEAGVQPCGLGARDTLRLESGMSLYGNDLDEDHTPLESGLSWSVALKDDRDFIGKQALLSEAKHKMIGLMLTDRGVLRGHQEVHLNNEKIGEITSGTFSPTLEKSIGLARIKRNSDVSIGDQVKIVVRNRELNAVVCKYPFVKNGQATN